ncbi:MAG: 3-phosphoshikimate 1-carboxyvinyltransferase [Gammaproteobacteria bacterium]
MAYFPPDLTISPCGALRATLRVASDKSISHRALILAALSQGVSTIKQLLLSEDTLSLLNALSAMGVRIEKHNAQVMVHGAGMYGLQAPKQALDMGNSGTAMRLLAGVLVAQDFSCELIGDASLSQRPMQRIILPLTTMGAVIVAQNGRPPLSITGQRHLRAIDYVLPVASAQVKSCLLLAGLFAQGTSVIRQPLATRDHTERLLAAFGYPIHIDGLQVSLCGGGILYAHNISVPADMSAAAFFIVAASIVPDSCITLLEVGVNPTRIGVIDILRRMGADIEIMNQRMLNGEPVAEIIVKYAPLTAIDIPSQLIASAIDEFPIIFVAAACASGVTTLRGAAELRVKESDRLHVMAQGLSALGIKVQEYPDGIRIEGGQFSGGTVASGGDHRVAMAFAIAGLVAENPVQVQDCSAIATSFPDFYQCLQKLSGETIVGSENHR